MNDRKLGVDVDGVTDSNGNYHIEYYLPDVLSTTDYYAFGMEMPGRQGVPANGRYRFGFNGMERDGESPLDGNSYTTDFRQYVGVTEAQGQAFGLWTTVLSGPLGGLSSGGNAAKRHLSTYIIIQVKPQQRTYQKLG